MEEHLTSTGSLAPGLASSHLSGGPLRRVRTKKNLEGPRYNYDHRFGEEELGRS